VACLFLKESKWSTWRALILFTLVTIDFILITDVNIYRSLHMNAPLNRYPLLALVREDNLSLPSYRTDSSSLSFLKRAIFKFTPFLKFLTVLNWSNVKFRCSLIGPKVRILNMLTPLVSIYVTFFHCCHPSELLHVSH